MGLAGAKNKRKWAKDPNNTAWSRNTDTFGHKIMRSQGWEPGQYLGARDAPQTEYFTAANASHIRAVLKDDNMGLGARRNQGDECVGLDALQELLGRLNGKSADALQQERRKREDARVNRYLHRKLGTVRFVYGGLLVGDKVQQLADELKREKEAAKAAASAETSGLKDGKKEKKSKKRTAEQDNSLISEKKERKSKKRKTVDADDESKSKRKEKKGKKRKEKDDVTSEPKAEPESRNDEDSKTEDADEDTTGRKRSKKDKKDKRKKSKDDEDTNAGDGSGSQSKKKKKKRQSETEEGTESSKSSALSTLSSTPSASGTSTPVSEVPHRYLARRRFIAQKRAAVMDPVALNQIFMIKA